MHASVEEASSRSLGTMLFTSVVLHKFMNKIYWVQFSRPWNTLIERIQLNCNGLCGGCAVVRFYVYLILQLIHLSGNSPISVFNERLSISRVRNKYTRDFRLLAHAMHSAVFMIILLILSLRKTKKLILITASVLAIFPIVFTPFQ